MKIYQYPNFPIPVKKVHSAIILRYGAYGDQIVASSVLPYLKRDGYYVVYNCTEWGREIMLNNPHVDELWLQKTDEVINADLDKHWANISQGFERIINLNQSIEVECVAVQFRDKITRNDPWGITQEARRKKYNVNFYENNIKKAGFNNPIPPVKGELYLSDIECFYAKDFLRKYRNKFIIMWSWSGSGMNKAYPWSESIMVEFLTRHKDSIIITVGDEICRVLDPNHPRIISKAGRWTFRQTMGVTWYSNVIVSLDTGMLHLGGCWDHVGKIALLSANTIENLTKHFTNCVNLMAYDVECYPCHTLIYDRDGICPKGDTGASLCLEKISPFEVLDSLEYFYEKWEGNSVIKYERIRSQQVA